MRKSDALSLFFSASAILCFGGHALTDDENKYSMRQANVQQPYAGQRMTQGSIFEPISPKPESDLPSNDFVPGDPDVPHATPADFSQRLQGGVLLRFEFGLIVVNPIAPPESAQPTALTTDAIITSSVRSNIAAQSVLPIQNFEIETDGGIVTIRAKGESLDQAAQVINLTLRVPDVRQIVYTMPAEGWKTVGQKSGVTGVAGVQELQNVEHGVAKSLAARIEMYRIHSEA
jgi:hypothetical protein